MCDPSLWPGKPTSRVFFLHISGYEALCLSKRCYNVFISLRILELNHALIISYALINIKTLFNLYLNLVLYSIILIIIIVLY